MIGGADIVIPAKGDYHALDACVRMVREYWPKATFQDAITGEKFKRYEDLPFGPRLREILVYRDEPAEQKWDEGDAGAATNSMLYLVLSADCVTVVLDEPKEMHSMLQAIRSSLAMDLFNVFAEAA